MKRLLLTIIVAIFSLASYSQCTPLPYQDSLYNIWPDTIQNLPHVTQGAPYYTVLTIKTPSTLIEASAGDSSLTVIDTLGTQYYIGDWVVDSMELISLTGLPNGLSYGCDIASCMLPGDFLSCAYLQGTTNDPVGVYPIEILVNVYTHGTILLGGFIPVPVSTDLYSGTGSYEDIPGYKVVINGSASNVEMYNSHRFSLLQNFPNPFNGKTTIQFNTPFVEDVELSITDIFGRKVYTRIISSVIGLNSIDIDENLSSGIYLYSIQTKQELLSKSMVVR